MHWVTVRTFAPVVNKLVNILNQLWKAAQEICFKTHIIYKVLGDSPLTVHIKGIRGEAKCYVIYSVAQKELCQAWEAGMEMCFSSFLENTYKVAFWEM